MHSRALPFFAPIVTGLCHLRQRDPVNLTTTSAHRAGGLRSGLFASLVHQSVTVLFYHLAKCLNQLPTSSTFMEFRRLVHGSTKKFLTLSYTALILYRHRFLLLVITLITLIYQLEIISTMFRSLQKNESTGEALRTEYLLSYDPTLSLL